MNSMKRTSPCSKLLCLLLSVAVALSLSGCGEGRMVQKQISAMDTVMTLTAYGKNGEAGVNAAASTISAMDAMLNPELPTSTTYAINHANGANVVVSAQVAKMLSTAKTVYEHGEGSLDLSLYPAIKLWGFVNARYYVPTYEELSAVLKKKAFDQMILTSYPATGSYSVSFPAGTEISFASVAKGCAAENAVSAMRQAGVESGIVSLGGNVHALGLKPDGSRWNVAIRSPENDGSFLGIVEAEDEAVITSGGYERYFESEGWYYERRRNYYKNKKVPAAKRIEMLFLAQAVMTLLLGEPNTARARPTTLLSKDGGYARVFTKDPDCEMYLIAARMLKEVDAFLKRRDSRESFDEPTNSRHYVLLAYYMFALGIKDVQRLHFAENARKVALPLDEDLLGKSLECVKAAFEAVRDSNPNLSIDTIAKGSSLVDMLVIELNKRLNCE